MLSTTPEEVLRHPTNSSASKHHWTIPKAQRFGASFDSIGHYTIPSSLQRSSFSFGKAQRNPTPKQGDMQTDKKPAPGTYSPVARKRGVAWTFGRTVTLESGGGPEGPGPGSYEQNAGIGKSSVKYSLRAKTDEGGNTPTLKRNRRDSPGPGAYKPNDCLDSTGNYFLAKYPSSKASTFSPSKNTRFNAKPPASSPGPGTYDPRVALTSTGEYFLSAFKSSQSRKFGKAKSRPASTLRTRSPGPATYTLPTEFGTYGVPFHCYSRRSSVARRDASLVSPGMELIA